MAVPSPRRRAFWLLIPAVVIAAIASLMLPWNTGGLGSTSHPAATYAEAADAVVRMRAAQQASLNPVCLTKLMTHGNSVDKAIVLVHGYTSCPQQFDAIGNLLFDLGYNVLIAPLPHHGLADRLNTEQSLLTAEELRAYTDNILDIADGLGMQVTVAGMSGGGVITAWAAQYRSDVDLAVAISPAFGPKQVPTPLNAAIMNAFLILPNSFTWWDPVNKDVGGIPYAYPRYSTRAFAQFMRLGYAVRGAAQRNPPAARRIILVTNGNEPSVNNDLTSQVADLWRRRSTGISSYEFPATLGLPHDLIDPTQPDQQTDVVYPTLIELITGNQSSTLP